MRIMISMAYDSDSMMRQEHDPFFATFLIMTGSRLYINPYPGYTWLQDPQALSVHVQSTTPRPPAHDPVSVYRLKQLSYYPL